MRRMVIGAVVAAAFGLLPRHAQAQRTFTCESSGGQRRICQVDTSGGVRLTRQLSSSDCIQGRTWGSTRNAVWVSNGCRAQFITGVAAGSGRWGNNNDGRWNNDDRNNGRNDNDRARAAQRRCQQAVQRQVGNRRVSTWVENGSRNNVRIGWRASNGASGSCRLDRNGSLSVRVDRRR